MRMLMQVDAHAGLLIFYFRLALGALAAIPEHVVPLREREDMIRAATAYLQRHQESDGAYVNVGSSMLPFPRLASRQVTTAYVVQSLAAAGVVDVAALQYLVASIAGTDDTALVAMGVEAVGRAVVVSAAQAGGRVAVPGFDSLPDLVDRLMASASRAVDRTNVETTWWDTCGDAMMGTPTRARGADGSHVECTALVLRALSAAVRADPAGLATRTGLAANMAGAAAYLMAERGVSGWETTRDTVLAATALTDFARVASADALHATGRRSARLLVTVDGSEVECVDVNLDNMAAAIPALRGMFVDSEDLAKEAPTGGKHEVVVSWDGPPMAGGNLVAEVSAWQRPDVRAAALHRQDSPSPIATLRRAELPSGRNPLAVRQPFRVSYTVRGGVGGAEAVMFEQPLPTGVVVDLAATNEAMAGTAVSHVTLVGMGAAGHGGSGDDSGKAAVAEEVRPRVSFFVDRLAEGQDLTLAVTLVPETPGRLVLDPLFAFPMYDVTRGAELGRPSFVDVAGS